jgi:hypothetical protein
VVFSFIFIQLLKKFLPQLSAQYHTTEQYKSTRLKKHLWFVRQVTGDKGIVYPSVTARRSGAGSTAPNNQGWS